MRITPKYEYLGIVCIHSEHDSNFAFVYIFIYFSKNATKTQKKSEKYNNTKKNQKTEK